MISFGMFGFVLVETHSFLYTVKGHQNISFFVLLNLFQMTQFFYPQIAKYLGQTIGWNGFI